MGVDLITYIDRGGIIVYILIFLNIIGFTIMFWKLVVIALSSNKREFLINEIITFAKENNEEFKKDSIENFINRKISLQLHKRNKILDFKEVKKINIRDIKNIDAEKNPKEKYTLEFIINEDSSKYLWGFALSESKAQEIKEKLLKIFREEASYEVS